MVDLFSLFYSKDIEQIAMMLDPERKMFSRIISREDRILQCFHSIIFYIFYILSCYVAVFEYWGDGVATNKEKDKKSLAVLEAENVI